MNWHKVQAPGREERDELKLANIFVLESTDSRYVCETGGLSGSVGDIVANIRGDKRSVVGSLELCMTELMIQPSHMSIHMRWND